VFFAVAVLSGLFFIALNPPFGGGDEYFHYQRTAEVAYLHFLDKESDAPAGVVAFIDRGYAAISGGPYSRKEYAELAAIPLDAEHRGTLTAGIFTLHHPVAFLPQAIAFRLGAAVGARPLVLLYVARLAGLIGWLALTWLAIRRLPSHRFALTALAILPTSLFFSSFVNADPVTMGVAFLFIAEMFHAIDTEQPVSGIDIVKLAVLGLAAASTKGAYAPLALLALAIPAPRFESAKRRWISISAIVLPSLAAGLGWMWLVKTSFFAGARYETWGGRAFPDGQAAFVIEHPIAFMRILFDTILTTPFIPRAAVGAIAEMGHMSIHLPAIAYLVLSLPLAGAITLDPTAPRVPYPWRVRAWGAAVFAGCFTLTMALLYIQWTGYQAPIIRGFQGRYLLPILPLLFPLVRPVKWATPRRARACVILLALIGLPLALWALVAQSFG